MLKTKLWNLIVQNSRELERFIKFAIVGTMGAGVDFGTLTALVELFHVNVYLANTVSFTAAGLNNFILNSTWTFGDQANKQPARQLAQFFTVSIIGYLLNQALLYSFIEFAGLWYLLAKAIAIVVVLFWNFTANRLWTFRW